MNTKELCTNTIRVLSAEAVEKAKSGHPGTPMGAAPMAFELWSEHMRHNPENPAWINRDRFILSAGHASMLLYSLLHLFGYGLTINDLMDFRQFGSKTPGHPEYRHTVGVETTTGPLGQGFANGVGMAIAESYLASKFNREGYEIVDHYTYVLSGDGCMMEGITSEAASLAGTLGLGKLIVLYDSNNITIEGNTDVTFREDVGKRFDAYGWQVLKVNDGNDTDAIGKAIEEAKSNKKQPSLIIIKTVIGCGCPPMEGTAEVHGAPIGAQNIDVLKATLKWPSKEPFHVPQEVRDYMNTVRQKLKKYEEDWISLWNGYKEAYPELAAEFEAWYKMEIPVDLLKDEEFWKFEKKPNATRNISGEVLNRLAARIPNLVGGSADLAPSNKTVMKGKGYFLPEDHSGANFHFGVREHAMSAIGNGMALHGGLRPYVATFFVFSDYMKGGMRLSALMNLPVIYILTHDSIGVGEDGPTHQPVEQLASLRSIPGFTVFRPCDAKETAAGWYAAVTRKNGPIALVLTRQNLPYLEETGLDALKGAYIITDSDKEIPDIILMASGSEVQLAYEAGKVLKARGIDARVVSMPSWELFEEQGSEYKEKVLPSAVRKRIAIEAGHSMGWHKYTGLDGDILSIDKFGASGPYDKVFEDYGITVDNLVERAVKLANK
jgi:transketolase